MDFFDIYEKEVRQQYEKAPEPETGMFEVEETKEQPENVRNNPNAYMPEEIMSRCEIYTDLSMDVKKMYDKAWIQIKSDEE